MEYVGFSEEFFNEHNVKMISQFIKDEIRTKIACVFGNAEKDIEVELRKNDHTGEVYESMLNYIVYVDSLTKDMVETLQQPEYEGIFIKEIHAHNYIGEYRKLRLDITINQFWAKLICSRDGVTKESEELVRHTFDGCARTKPTY